MRGLLGALAILAMAVLLVFMAVDTEAALSARTRHEQATRAELVEQTVLLPGLRVTAAGAQVDPAARTALLSHLATLRNHGLVDEILVWSLQATLVDTLGAGSPGHPPPSAADRQLILMAASRPGYVFEPPHVGAGTIDVLHGADLNGDGRIDAVIETALPANGFTTAEQTAVRWLWGLSAAVFLLFVAVLVADRRRRRAGRIDAETGLLLPAEWRRRLDLAVRGGRAGTTGAVVWLSARGVGSVGRTAGPRAEETLWRWIGAQIDSMALAHHGLAGRTARDHFAIGFAGHIDLRDVVRAAERLAAALSRPAVGGAVPGGTVELAVSAGVSFRMIDGTPSDVGLAAELTGQAAAACGQAERSGVPLVVRDRTDRDAEPDAVLAGEFRRAVDTGALLLHFQPKVSATTAAITGAEALIRWEHPTRGLLLPGAFLPAVEPTAAVADLTTWTLQAAVGQLAAWRARGLVVPVAVNVSARMLHHGDLPVTVARCLAESGVPPELLVVEVTETAVVADPAAARDVLGQLARLGVQVSIDDFGTGQTSLSLITDLPVHEIKVDRRFVAGLREEGGAGYAAVIRAVAGLAHELGGTVVAEGVEDGELAAAVAELGCDQLQGYGIARPMPPAECTAWLLARTVRAPAR